MARWSPPPKLRKPRFCKWRDSLRITLRPHAKLRRADRELNAHHHKTSAAVSNSSPAVAAPAEIDRLENCTNALHQLCLEAVERLTYREKFQPRPEAFIKLRERLPPADRRDSSIAPSARWRRARNPSLRRSCAGARIHPDAHNARPADDVSTAVGIARE